MLKKILLLLLLFSGIVVFAQGTDTLNRVDSKGRKYGLWKKVDGQGRVKYVGFFKENYPIGEFTYYYSSGRVKSVLIHSDKGRRAYAKLYYENGATIMGEGLYVNQIKDSLWRYYNGEGKLIRDEFFSNKKPNGSWKTYYANGIVFEEINYKDSIKDGFWKQNFENGNPKLEAKYINGKLEGGFKIYYPSGILKLYGVYKNAMREGKWVTYNENGSILKVENYVHGVLIETKEEYDKKQRELEKLFNTRLPDVYTPGSTQPPSENSGNQANPEDYY